MKWRERWVEEMNEEKRTDALSSHSHYYFIEHCYVVQKLCLTYIE